MNTLEIINKLKHLSDFIGVYAIDEIPYKVGKLVFNTHTSNLGGEHWIALVIRPNKLIYFDPLNLPLTPMIMKMLTRFQKPLHIIQYSAQSLNSRTCGKHVVFFLLYDYPAYSDDMLL